MPAGPPRSSQPPGLHNRQQARHRPRGWLGSKSGRKGKTVSLSWQRLSNSLAVEASSRHTCCHGWGATWFTHCRAPPTGSAVPSMSSQHSLTWALLRLLGCTLVLLQLLHNPVAHIQHSRTTVALWNVGNTHSSAQVMCLTRLTSTQDIPIIQLYMLCVMHVSVCPAWRQLSLCMHTETQRAQCRCMQSVAHVLCIVLR